MEDEEPAKLKAMVQAARAEVERLLDNGVPRVIGVVVNRVATAERERGRRWQQRKESVQVERMQ